MVKGLMSFAYFPWFPFILCFLMPFWIYSAATSLFGPESVIRPAAILAIVAIFLLSLTSYLFRNAARASAFTSLILIMVFAPFGYMYITCSIILVGLYIVLSVRNLFDNRLIFIFNLVCLSLAITVAMQFVLDRTSYASNSIPSPFDRIALAVGVRPSIIHIVLDGYSDERILRGMYNYDNGLFLEELRDIGFVVASDARSPYGATWLSMASVFSGTYVTEQLDSTAASASALSSSGPAYQVLVREGYSLYFIPSGVWFITHESPDAEVVGYVNRWYDMTLFEHYFFRSGLFGYLRNVVYGAWSHSEYDTYTKSALEYRGFGSLAHPFFLYEHVLAPHPPFTMDRHGSPTNEWVDNFSTIRDGEHATREDELLQKMYRRGYIEKLMYTNGELYDQITHIIEDVPSPKVILLHGDHGGGSHYVHGDPSRSCASERLRTLFAIYSDVQPVKQAFAFVENEPFNLVNTYRILFTALGAGEIPPLESRSYLGNLIDGLVLVDEARLAQPCGMASDAAPPGKSVAVEARGALAR